MKPNGRISELAVLSGQGELCLIVWDWKKREGL